MWERDTAHAGRRVSDLKKHRFLMEIAGRYERPKMGFSRSYLVVVGAYHVHRRGYGFFCNKDCHILVKHFDWSILHYFMFSRHENDSSVGV